ncbi:hypothetical protein COLO4_27985 [Corchorus olitorius]|uniref:SPX domain-containing protein n=1 Tax=Corchorus olitorius TaxID=93759 RepID=A0A1R3HNH4_9ROSI|nr:hypothetical protein COLO4_27985 [Corchorus olitorius]
MKFGKEFASQMVPEWQEAYMDYDYLKTLLKEIHVFKHRNRPAAATGPNGLTRSRSLYQAFSGLIHRHHHSGPLEPTSPDIEDHPILVNPIVRDGSHRYQTTFLKQAEDGGEYELVFFRRLDDEFNKVEKFYKKKVEEVTKDAEVLNRQMDALIAFRIKVDNPQGWSWDDRSGDLTRLATDVAASTAALHASTPAGARASRRVEHMEIIDEGPSYHERSDEDNKEEQESNHKKENVELQLAIVVQKPKGRRPAPLQILNQITSRYASRSYMKMVDNSYLGSNEEVAKLMERVEATFIKHFANSNRSKGMNILRPKARKERHRITFSTGFFAGCAFALILALILMIRARHIMEEALKEERNKYMETLFPLYSFIVAVVPFSIRLLQCLRRMFEEKDIVQGYNGIKYFITIVALCLRSAYSLNKGLGWEILAIIFSVAAAIVGTYWDLVYDWGLLQRHSRNKWLRDKLLVSRKSVYFGAMALNCLLRFAWLQTVFNFNLFALHRQTLITIVASLEIIRRGVWNFFRLENEHLNNVGKYRAFKSVPLPFNYDEDEDKDE